MIEKILTFFNVDLWKIPMEADTPVRNVFIRMLRLIISAGRGFNLDECYLKASALTFYSILSIVPVLAVAFGIAKGFGFEQHLESTIRERFQDQPEVATSVIQFAYSMLQHAQGGVIAGIGIIVLLYTVIRLMANIETSLNDIWKVRTARPWARRFSDYLATIIFCPIFFAASSSVSIFMMTQIIRATREIGYYDTLSPLIALAFHLFPFILAWSLFSFIYILMPNTRVKLRYGVIGGVLAGTAYQLLQYVYIKFQIGVSSYGAIYGSFAALPLFLMWIQLSWLIVLAGAEIAYHAENENYEFFKRAVSSQQMAAVSKRLLGVLFACRCVQAFLKGEAPVSLTQLAQESGVSQLQTRDILETLTGAGILAELKKQGSEECFQPGKDVGAITVMCVCDAMDSAKGHTLMAYSSPDIATIDTSIKAIEEETKRSPANLTLSNLRIS